MAREAVFAAGAVVVFSVVLLAASLVPGIVAEPTEDVRQSRLAIQDTTIGAGQVSGETATLTVTSYLRHDGGPAENVTVVYRAIDTDTGLIATTVKREVGTVSGGGELTVTGNVSVERQGGYQIATFVYRNDRRVEAARTTVNGVGELQPSYADSTLRFHRFEGLSNLPAVQYSIADVEGNRTTMDVSTFLTNAGDEPAGNLRVVVQARQADSNIVADRAEMRVREVTPGATTSPSTTLTVADGYNYYLDAVLYRDGVIVGTTQSAANLNPTETLSTNETHRDVGLEVKDFEQGRGDRAIDEPTPTPIDTEQPGFSIGAVAAALFILVLLVRRWSV